MAYLQNCWYAAALSSEIGTTPLQRVLLDRPVALYRTDAGAVVALADRCPHRFAPLHQGQVFGDALRCPYHGLQFGPDGACVHNPLGKGHIPVAARVDSYPLSEADGIVWIWFGNANPDPANIPGFAEFTDGERWATVEGHIHVAANYFLVADNLLDLSHAEFLHPDLASEGFNRRVKLTVRQEGDVICADNLRIAEPISRAFRIAMGGETAPDLVDRRSLVRWEAPANLTLHFDAYPTGRVDSGVTSIQAHLITPETATTCHYFYRIARDYLVGDEAASAQISNLELKFATNL